MKTLEIAPGLMRPTVFFLDEFVAHKISALTECGAPELGDETGMLNTFILTSCFQVVLERKRRAFLFNIVRRVEASIGLYRDARLALLTYVETPSTVVSPYFTALIRFEMCISQAYQACELLMTLARKKLFDRGDGGVVERLQTLYVDSKHMDQMIAADRTPDNATSGLWLTNNGFESARAAVTFTELHEVLTDLVELAKRVTTMPPAPSEIERSGAGEGDANRVG